MLSDSWLKDMHPCLVFVIVHIKRQRKSEEKASDDQDQESDDQDVQVVDIPEESDGPYRITIVPLPM